MSTSVKETLNSKQSFWFFIGPAFLVSVGYMDPGNWATSLEAGSRYGYALLWVITLASLIAVLMQLLSAKLGIASGKNLAQMIRVEHPGKGGTFLLSTAALAMVATDLAEFLGVAVALNLLFDIPLVVAIFLTIFDVLLILWLERFGFRWVEMTILAFVATIGLGYVVELWLAQPEWADVAKAMFVPNATIMDTTALFIAMGILGATVMPHNLYLHSHQVMTRRDEGCSEETCRRFYKMMRWDTILALTAAWIVNSAILIMASAAFHEKGLLITDIDEAYKTLGPLLGEAAALTFGIALLASGIASSTTGTLAGQIVFESFFKKRPVNILKIRLFIRLGTMIPAAIAILLSTTPLKLLVLSQVILSMQLPFAVIPLVRMTSNPMIMGDLVNDAKTKITAWSATALIVGLNIWLLVMLAVEAFK
ncbi:Nramp family divalent metal transporter [Hydrogenovibrio marinus]|uniref:Manganese transporter n=1 Tax=Hydrogenovibrio marinus TaxID=28885 RepID=A0A066ZNJ7_HYDMR|nr:Nramp family divalent metal transporter [Hydrogenovibrio marinus]KDN95082.1 manganese transporter [Hydrogenovibrio marinus]BBN59554.1 divalent metal cation transporter MntH 1 [Hydrogenovibrio marinus]